MKTFLLSEYDIAYFPTNPKGIGPNKYLLGNDEEEAKKRAIGNARALFESCILLKECKKEV